MPQIKFLVLLVVGIAISFTALAASPLKIQSIKLIETQAGTKLEISTNKKPQYQLTANANSSQITLTFQQAFLIASLPVLSTRSLIDSIASTRGKSGEVNILLNLKAQTTYKTWLRKLGAHPTYRYTVMIKKIKPAKAPDIISKNYQANVSALNNVANKTISTAATTPTSPYLVVVIDPGHGGKDPGAIGARGYQEKNVVLAISKDLQADLVSLPGVKVYLTRDSDKFISLRGRLGIARKYKADIFIAMHADAYRNSDANGASVFALSERGATSESARWLAEKENQSEMLGGADLNDKDYLLKSVLIDMSQTATINASLELGNSILQQLREMTKLHSHKVGQAAFVVLKSPDISSILIENGFMSNPVEENKLITPSYQELLAERIKNGVVVYFKTHAAPTTIFMQQYK